MDPIALVRHSQNRLKVWNWSEICSLTGKSIQEIKGLIDNQEPPPDPLYWYTQNRKNYNSKVDSLILKYYTNPDMFRVVYTDEFVATKFVLIAKTPLWAIQILQDDWYWKQKWLAKYKSIFLWIPLVKNIYLGCSVANQISTKQSDIDLLIQTNANSVWVVKVYFALISKILKYYNFPVFKGIFYFITQNHEEFTKLKTRILKDKIKVDFGLVFENWDDVNFAYQNKERHFTIWNNIEIRENLNYYEPKILKLFGLVLIPVYWLILPFTSIVGVIHYLYHKKLSSKNINMIIRWQIYSQYNVIF